MSIQCTCLIAGHAVYKNSWHFHLYKCFAWQWRLCSASVSMLPTIMCLYIEHAVSIPVCWLLSCACTLSMLYVSQYADYYYVHVHWACCKYRSMLTTIMCLYIERAVSIAALSLSCKAIILWCLVLMKKLFKFFPVSQSSGIFFSPKLWFYYLGQ